MRLSPITAAALAAALVAAAAVLAFTLVPTLLVWAAFIGWASYDHSGADVWAALRSTAGMIFGVVMAWAALVIVALDLVPLLPPLAMALSAGIASFLIVMASSVPLLGLVPTVFYGFAATFAYLSILAAGSILHRLTALDWQNPLFPVSASLLIGTGLGIAHGYLATRLAAARRSGSRQRLRLDGTLSSGAHPPASLP